MKTAPSFWRFLALLSGLSILTPMVVDTYLPAMPATALFFGVSDGDIQFTLASLNLGIAAGQLIYGPLADAYGRRPVLIVSMAVFSLLGLAQAFAPDVATLNVLRFFHGVTTASAMILVRAVVRDLYDGPIAAKMLAYLFVTGGTMPIIAPIIGGHFVVWFGWQSTFFFVAIAGLFITLSITLFLKETGVKSADALRAGEIVRSMSRLCRSRVFMAYAIGGIGPYAGLFAILTAISPTLIGYLKVSPIDFGYLFGALMVGNLAASMVAGRLAERLGLLGMIFYGMALSVVSGAAALAFSLAGIVTPATIVLPSLGFMAGFALLIPAVSAGAMSPHPEMAGRASSLLGLAHYGTGALVAFLLGIFADGTERPMIVALFIAGLITLGSYVLIARTKAQ